MQNRQRPSQLINSCSQVAKPQLEKIKNKTLPQNTIQSAIQSQKVVKVNGITQNTTQRTTFKLKFNTSYDNLRCFISQTKPERYRSVSSRLSKQSKSQACLSNTKSNPRYQRQDSIIQACKSQTQKNQSINSKQLSSGNQKNQQRDLSHILSNQIIHSIERKGIDYDWSDIEQIKSEQAISENNQENQLQELFDPFSDHKINKRLSFNSKEQLSSSLINQQTHFLQGMNDQLIQDIEQSLYIDVNSINYLNYENNYDNNYDNNFEKNYSFASTMQPYSHLYYPMTVNEILACQATAGLRSMPSSMFHSCEFIIRPEGLGKDPRTTLMIKNIPNKYTIHFLSEQIDLGFGNSYDFLYLPCDTKSGANQGYGFINFIDLDALKKFYQKFHGKKWKRFKSQKICNLTYARLQGINSLIEHFQNSKVLNHKQKKYQPIIKSLSQIHHLIKKQQNQQEQN